MAFDGKEEVKNKGGEEKEGGQVQTRIVCVEMHQKYGRDEVFYSKHFRNMDIIPVALIQSIKSAKNQSFHSKQSVYKVGEPAAASSSFPRIILAAV